MRRVQASRVESRSSARWTGNPERACRRFANLRARAVIHWSVPSMLSGSPTTRASGFQAWMTRSTASQSGLVPRTGIVSSGVAVRVTVCPIAIPMRLPSAEIECDQRFRRVRHVGWHRFRRQVSHWPGIARPTRAHPAERPRWPPNGSAWRREAGAAAPNVEQWRPRQPRGESPDRREADRRA